MNEQDLRNLVREAIARQATPSTQQAAHVVPARFHLHPSHGMFILPAGADSDGPCIIEPMVMCNHCGYCKSYGH